MVNPEKIKQSVCRENAPSEQRKAIWEIIRKDLHLIEAAKETDKFVISNERRCIDTINRIALKNEENYSAYTDLLGVFWVHPDHPSIFIWLNGNLANRDIPQEWDVLRSTPASPRS